MRGYWGLTKLMHSWQECISRLYPKLCAYDSPPLEEPRTASCKHWWSGASSLDAPDHPRRYGWPASAVTSVGLRARA